MAPKSDGSKRFCLDLRAINDRSEAFNWPAPRTEELLRRASGKHYYTKLDADSGFWQIPLESVEAAKTAFTFEGRHLEFKVMPFGARNAPAHFQHAIDELFARERANGFLEVYMDDILIHSNSWAEHMTHLELVLQKCVEAKLKLKGKKCEIA